MKDKELIDGLLEFGIIVEHRARLVNGEFHPEHYIDSTELNSREEIEKFLLNGNVPITDC